MSNAFDTAFHRKTKDFDRVLEHKMIIYHYPRAGKFQPWYSRIRTKIERRKKLEISKQIKKYRNSMGFSQEELAEKLYVSRQTISNWETGVSQS